MKFVKAPNSIRVHTTFVKVQVFLRSSLESFSSIPSSTFCFARMKQIQKNGVGDGRIVIGAGLTSAPAMLSLPLDREMGTRHKDRISPT